MAGGYRFFWLSFPKVNTIKKRAKTDKDRQPLGRDGVVCFKISCCISRAFVFVSQALAKSAVWGECHPLGTWVSERERQIKRAELALCELELQMHWKRERARERGGENGSARCSVCFYNIWICLCISYNSRWLRRIFIFISQRTAQQLRTENRQKKTEFGIESGL